MTFSPLFKKLLFAWGASDFGDWFRRMALPWIIISDLGLSSVEVSLSGLAPAAAVFCGVLFRLHPLTRLGPRNALVITTLGAAGGSFLMSALLREGMLTFPRIIFIVVCVEFLLIAGGSSSEEIFRDTAGENPKAAKALREKFFWLSRCLGCPLGGLLVLYGSWFLLLIDGISFLPLACILIFSTAFSRKVASPPGKQCFYRGWAFVSSQHDLLVLFILTFVRDTFCGIGFTLGAEIVARDLGEGPFLYGLWLGITGLFGVLGSDWALALLRQGQETRRRLFLLSIVLVPLASLLAGDSGKILPFTISYSAFAFFGIMTHALFEAECMSVKRAALSDVQLLIKIMRLSVTPLLWLLIAWVGRSSALSAQQTLRCASLLGLVLVLSCVAYIVLNKSLYRKFLAHDS